MESLTNTLCLLSLQHTQCVCGHGGCVGKSSCVLEILGRARVVYKWRKCLLEGMHGGLWAAGRNYACRQHLLLGEGLSLEQNNCILEELSPMHHFCLSARCILAACDMSTHELRWKPNLPLHQKQVHGKRKAVILTQQGVIAPPARKPTQMQR